MSNPAPAEVAASGDTEEVRELRARVAALEAALASTRERAAAQPDATAEFRGALYEAYVYGLGRTLSLYDPDSVRVLVREMGRRIREYLEEVGYDLGSGKTLDEVLSTTVNFFVSHGFVELELVKWEDNVIQARWFNLLGLRAYERIVAAGGEPFISCPLNAVINDGLVAFDKGFEPLKHRFDVERGEVESWEAVVDMPPEAGRERLSLDAERMFAVEREQSRQLRVRDEFIRIASHELSTPLTSTKLALRLLDGAELPETAKHAVGVLHRQVRRLEQLVAEMLDTTRLQIGRVRLERTEVDLVAATRGVIDLLATVHASGPQQIRLHGDAAAVGMWDAARLDQIVTNLLANAIKYGEGRPIDVTITRHGEHARLQVRDHGIGIAAEALGRIFDPFERAAPVETHGGLGLGLYIARRFVEMHGGRIAVDSEPGAGATFVVDLPLTTAIEPGVMVEAPHARRERAS